MLFRRGRSAYRNSTRISIIIFILWNFVDVFWVQWALSNTREDDLFASPAIRNQRVYIASIHWQNEKILRSHWNQALVDLARAMGPENVFVSIYESGSFDDSKGALQELDAELGSLGVQRSIVLSNATHEDAMDFSKSLESGWVDTPGGQRERRRIPYLADLRNLSLQPLIDMARKGEEFDRVLFLNDVVFSTDDVLRLLNTNDGNYAAACSLDFSESPRVYDTFAIRDEEGHELLMQTWPYFRSHRSRHAIKANQPVPVKSCWNGMVFMSPDPFTYSNLKFRGIPDSLATYHIEGSECCLIHADNPSAAKQQVFVNPAVRVGYSGMAYDWMVAEKGAFSSWRVLVALWENRFLRWATTTRLKEWLVERRVQKWQREGSGNQEHGRFCLINEMQVLIKRGWAHV